MKQSQVKPGVQAMLSLGGRRGSIRVTVRYLRNGLAMVSGKPTWVVLAANGVEHVVTARQLQPMPHVACQTELAADYMRHLSVVSSEPGQTIDAGDTVITTTLHRLEPACPGCRSASARRDGGGHHSTCPRF